MKKIEVSAADIAEFTDMVRKVNFFSRMTMGQLGKILEFVMLFECAKGERICKQGGPGDAFYLVQSGRLAVSVKKGFFSAAQKVASLGRGEFFGEMALLERSPRTATVECEEGSKLFVLLAEHFEEVARENPDFSAYMKSLALGRKFELDHKE